ncbi:MAG: hypothetical protein R3F11_02065 [Verrucomicrobiales bacterium]
MQTSCGGHETFLYLDEDKALLHCPDHREMDEIGSVERTETSATIYFLSGAPWCRIEFAGSDHILVSASDSSTIEIPQVHGPWRTWLPRLLPD